MPYHIEDLLPLADLPEGKTGEIILMVGGRGMTRRLCEMGLTPGAKVRMVKKAPVGGPIILEVRSTEIAIGRGLASKMLVKPES
uniref:Ferrous iron transport protein A n=1 Tax=Candidatus Methanomethylicus mesodigestus TaxID=1867258 RepID=A0A7C3NCF5_9CREN